MVLTGRHAVNSFEVAKMFECLPQGAKDRASQHRLVAIKKDSHNELCFIVRDCVSGVAKSLLCVLLWGNATSSPVWLGVLQEMLDPDSVIDVGQADMDDPMLFKVLTADRNQRVEECLLLRMLDCKVVRPKGRTYSEDPSDRILWEGLRNATHQNSTTLLIICRERTLANDDVL
jgi:hypothetical protein